MGKKKSEKVWIEEKCYFGLMEFQRYRRRGDQVQLHICLSLPIEEREGFIEGDEHKEYIAPVDGVENFLQKYQDCSFEVCPGYTANNGEKVPPSLFLQGWADLSPDEINKCYLPDKQYIIGSRVWVPPPKNKSLV